MITITGTTIIPSKIRFPIITMIPGKMTTCTVYSSFALQLGQLDNVRSLCWTIAQHLAVFPLKTLYYESLTIPI